MGTYSRVGAYFKGIAVKSMLSKDIPSSNTYNRRMCLCALHVLINKVSTNIESQVKISERMHKSVMILRI